MDDTLMLVGIVLIVSALCGLIIVLLVLWSIRRCIRQIDEQIANVKGLMGNVEKEDEP